MYGRLCATNDVTNDATIDATIDVCLWCGERAGQVRMQGAYFDQGLLSVETFQIGVLLVQSRRFSPGRLKLSAFFQVRLSVHGQINSRFCRHGQGAGTQQSMAADRRRPLFLPTSTLFDHQPLLSCSLPGIHLCIRISAEKARIFGMFRETPVRRRFIWLFGLQVQLLPLSPANGCHGPKPLLWPQRVGNAGHIPGHGFFEPHLQAESKDRAHHLCEGPSEGSLPKSGRTGFWPNDQTALRGACFAPVPASCLLPRPRIFVPCGLLV